MKGIEESEKLFWEYGIAVIEKYPELKNHIAAGLCGGGSECYGFDDEISRDHDFNNGFCFFLDDEYMSGYSFLMEKEYLKLPGVREGGVSRMGQGRKGVFSVSEFYERYTGERGVPDTLIKWLKIPSECLAEATNGKVFYDAGGKFTEIREALLKGYPEDVRIKKVASAAASCAQAGQYNFMRCAERGENGAAVLYLAEFVKSAVSLIFLLNRRYCPYCKWALRALSDLPLLGDMSEVLNYLLWSENEGNIKVKSAVIEDLCALIIKEMRAQGLSDGNSDYLEDHAFSALNKIKDAELRNMHIMIG